MLTDHSLPVDRLAESSFNGKPMKSGSFRHLSHRLAQSHEPQRLSFTALPIGLLLLLSVTRHVHESHSQPGHTIDGLIAQQPIARTT